MKKISATEEIIGFEFPESFKTLYLKVNGFENYEWLANMISIWSLERIANEYEPQKNFVGFGDYLIHSHVYGFLKNQPGIFKCFDLTTPVIEKIADTFEEAIALINNNDDLLY